jgi:hypothetical protein
VLPIVREVNFPAVISLNLAIVGNCGNGAALMADAKIGGATIRRGSGE